MIIDMILFRTLGDVLMSTPIIRELKQKYPDSYIRFHTEKENAPLLTGNPHLAELISYEHGSYPNVYQYLADKKTDVICRMAMANHYDTCWHHNPETRNQHMIDWYASRTGLLKGPLSSYHIEIFPTAEQMGSMNGRVKEYGPEPYCIMHTTSRVPSKDWPIDRFKKLADMIWNELKIRTVQIGGLKDAIINSDHVADFTGLPIHQTIALMGKAKFYIGIDSGPSYIAEALNLPCFIINGSTMATPQESSQKGPFIGPIGPSVKYFEPQRPTRDCCKPIPCYTHCMLNKPCIGDIIPETVMNSVKELVNV